MTKAKEFIEKMFVSPNYDDRRWKHKAFQGDVVVKIDGVVVDRFDVPEHFNLEGYAKWWLQFAEPELKPDFKCKYERLFKIELTVGKYTFAHTFDVIELGKRRAKILG